MGPKKLAARAAAHRDAIAAARAAGYTWAELAARLGAPSAGAMRKALARAGRYKPERQLPLPEPAALTPSASPAPRPAPRTNSSGFGEKPRQMFKFDDDK